MHPDAVFRAVAESYGLSEEAFVRRHERHMGRAVAAWLCRRHTKATLRELAERLGLGRADSVPNLTRRVDKLLRDSRPFAAELGEIIRRLEGDGEEPMRVGRKTKNQG
jgi:chromosomal replication initiation ATPase DnaA